MTRRTLAAAPMTNASEAGGRSRSIVETTKGWDIPTLAGAGALRSSANAMMTFLAAFMDYTESPLKPAIEGDATASDASGRPEHGSRARLAQSHSRQSMSRTGCLAGKPVPPGLHATTRRSVYIE
jgi:hypothetical protein